MICEGSKIGVIYMVIAKSKIPDQKVVEPGLPGIIVSKWHKVDGTLKVAGSTLKSRILAYLESIDGDVPYTDVRDALVKQYPSDYNRDGSSSKCLNNLDIKIMVSELVKEDKVVDQ